MHFVVNQNHSPSAFEKASEIAELVGARVLGNRGFGFLHIRVSDSDSEALAVTQELLASTGLAFCSGPDHLY